jgi:hypothetical protein
MGSDEYSGYALDSAGETAQRGLDVIEQAMVKIAAADGEPPAVSQRILAETVRDVRHVLIEIEQTVIERDLLFEGGSRCEDHELRDRLREHYGEPREITYEMRAAAAAAREARGDA